MPAYFSTSRYADVLPCIDMQTTGDCTESRSNRHRVPKSCLDLRSQCKFAVPQLEESQARKDASVEGDDMQRRLQYLIDPWSQTEQQVIDLPASCHVPASAATRSGAPGGPGGKQWDADYSCGRLAQLMQQVRAVCQQAGGAEQPADADDLAEALLAMGHSVTVRTALGGGGGGECLRNLRHVFLSVRMQACATSLHRHARRAVLPSVGACMRATWPRMAEHATCCGLRRKVAGDFGCNCLGHV